jgi:two-component system response regulator FixJ
LEFALEVEGYVPCLFERAQMAIDSPEILSADCLVIDYALPDMDGLAMLEALRGRGLAAPAIVIASLPTARCRAEARKAGALLLEKPLMGETLQDHLRRIFAEPASAHPN